MELRAGHPRDIAEEHQSGRPLRPRGVAASPRAASSRERPSYVCDGHTNGRRSSLDVRMCRHFHIIGIALFGRPGTKKLRRGRGLAAT